MIKNIIFTYTIHEFCFIMNSICALKSSSSLHVSSIVILVIDKDLDTQNCIKRQSVSFRNENVIKFLWIGIQLSYLRFHESNLKVCKQNGKQNLDLKLTLLTPLILVSYSFNT